MIVFTDDEKRQIRAMVSNTRSPPRWPGFLDKCEQSARDAVPDHPEAVRTLYACRIVRRIIGWRQ